MPRHDPPRAADAWTAQANALYIMNGYAISRFHPQYVASVHNMMDVAARLEGICIAHAKDRKEPT